MADLDLNSGYESKIVVLTKDRDLAELINEAEKSIQQKINKVKGEENRFLKDFVCSYAALSTELHEKEIFAAEKNNNYFNLLKTYCIYASSKAALNKLNDKEVEQLRELNAHALVPIITQTELNKTSDCALLEPIIKKMINIPQGNSQSALKYSYFRFFEQIKETCKNRIFTNCSAQTLKKLNELRIIKTGLDFQEPQPPKKIDNRAEKSIAENDLEKLPEDLPTYEPNPKAKYEGIIGNTSAKEAIHSALIRVLKYDPEKKSNPFKEKGDFKNAFILYGKPGVGKNYTIDSLLNHIKSTASQYNENFQIVDLSKGIRSIYKDRSSQILQKYMSIQEKGEKTYINIIDEADGIFTTNENAERSEESTKLLSEMKKAINTADKGNSLFIFLTNYAEKFEAALKQRFTLIEMQGPVTPEDFAKLLKQELNGRNELKDSTIYDLGKKIHNYKKEMEATIPITGRDVKKITSQFVSGDDKILIHNEQTIRSSTYEQMKTIIPQLAPKLTYQTLSDAIDEHIENLKQSINETTARYNR